MRVVRERPVRGAQKASRHPEVNQKNATALELDDQILATALDGRDALRFQLGRHLGRLVRAYETRVVDPHPLEATPDGQGLELPGTGLALRNPGNAPSGLTMGCPGPPRDGA